MIMISKVVIRSVQRGDPHTSRVKMKMESTEFPQSGVVVCCQCRNWAGYGGHGRRGHHSSHYLDRLLH